MPVRRKHFPCGHHGKGQHCHVCAHQELDRKSREAQRSAKIAEKIQRTHAHLNDLIDLQTLPSPQLVDKARHIIQHITRTRDYRPFLGKRMEADRTLLSIPLNYRYRILFRIHPDRITPLSVMTHETYNHAKHHFVT